MLLRVLRNLFPGRRGSARPAAEPGDGGAPDTLRERLVSAARLHSAGDVAGARELYRAVLEEHPANVDAHHMLGLLELYCGNHPAAQASIRRALELDGRNAVLHRHLGMVLELQGNLAEALQSCATAAVLDPRDAEAHCRLGNVLVMARRATEAAASYRRAIELEPESSRFKFNLSLVLLLQGDYAEGWRNYEFRWDGSAELAGRKRDFAQPQWRGEPLAGRTILLHAEQAFGDTLQFVRYAALVARRNDSGRVLLECQPELKRLFESLAGRVEVVAQGEPLPAFDIHCPLLSLPLAFGTTLASIPADAPYLNADPMDIERWRPRLPGGRDLRVGLVWSGKARRMNQWHNLTLPDLAPLFAIAGMHFFSLQKAQTGYAINDDCAGTPVVDFTGELNDFADTAALICNLHLVISVDTAVAHLCGALGKPVWLLARYDADWRWLLDRPDSPWYPSMRIFRQREPGHWSELIRRVASALHAEAARANGTP